MIGKIVMRLLITLPTVLLFFMLVMSVSAQTDTAAPEINNVEIINATGTSVIIKWETDENSDSAVNYGLTPDYGMVRVPVADRTTHSITLNSLEGGRTYFFRVISADDEGNQGISADYKIQTDADPKSGEQQGDGNGLAGDPTDTPSSTPPPTADEIMEEVNEIKDPVELKKIINAVIKVLQGITEDLTIVGPPTVIPETTSAQIKWVTDREATSEVLFSPTQSFDGTNFAFSQNSPQGATQDHDIRLIGLEPFTEYSFKVKSTDSYSITGESRVFTFRTKASLPDIRNLRVLKVEENASTLAWDTTVPAKAIIEYQDLTTGAQNSVGRPTLATSHQMRLADLTLGTRYVAFVIVENSGGDRVRSQPIQFITIRDIAAPFISNVTNESTLFPGGESRIQTIIEWNTDEAAACQMTYQEGVAGGTEPTVREKETKEYNTRHVEVIVDFAPATVYQFWLDCEDVAGNSVKSENFVLFTPIQEKNIIDLILENFQSTFGWVKNIGG